MSVTFFDTNVLVYFYDRDEPDKRAIAQKRVTTAVAAIWLP